MNFFFVLELISMIVGLFFIVMALWELRLGQSRERFLTFSFSGLVLTQYIFVDVKFASPVHTDRRLFHETAYESYVK